MAGRLLDCELTVAPGARVRFALATREDDAALRCLLRSNPMHGEVSLTFEREPDYFRGTGIAGAEDQTIVAFDRKRLVCMGRCSIQSRHINGRPARLGYLSELRLDESARGRFDILRGGYRFFRELCLHNPPDLLFTSIAADNTRSIRLLERGLPGLPRYCFLAEYTTLLLPVPRTARADRSIGSSGLRCVAGSPDLLEAMASCLNTQSRLHQLSLEWTPQLLLGLKEFGLPLSDFIVALDDNRVTGCAALWDQRSFRQTVVRGYSGRIALAKPWLQLGAFLFNGPRLPAVGSTLAHAFLSPLAADPNRPNLMSLLLNRSLVEARKREIEFLTIGFAANDPRLSTVEGSRRSRRYLSRLYQVSWPGEHDEPQLDGRLLGPEVALL